jgi:hypothetical protein
MLPLSLVTARDGYLAQLAGKGYEVEAPPAVAIPEEAAPADADAPD